MKKILIACFFAITFTTFAMPQETQKPTILTDNLCDLLCKEAQKKSEQMGLDISFAISDANGLPRLYRRFGEALVLTSNPQLSSSASFLRLNVLSSLN